MEDLTKLNRTELQNFLNIYENQISHIAQRMLEEDVINNKTLYKHFIKESKRLIFRKQQCKQLLNPNLKKETKISKRSSWKERLVYDFITEQTLPCYEYFNLKGLSLRKVFTHHIEHEEKIEWYGQILHAKWIKGDE